MQMRKNEDLRLLDRLMFKDKEALEQLVESYGTLLFQVAVRITGEKKLAEQILKDVFRELWNDPQDFADSNENFLSTYLVKRCKWLCVQKEELHISSLLSKKSKKYIAKSASVW
ncbi:hypothetical protein KUV80_13230 [Fictibacillus nanhaiensis]|uniref:RNA polymerase sigma factor n=1 Tax=Fictibacillus nanhaiensis TaxID=742169 RepID=UPI001C961CD3|nr:sigma factor [Fictibacillus nanhaiensis]MBY6037626.1 hypothetical protein [Fictibacillus nanhaiensis]